MTETTVTARHGSARGVVAYLPPLPSEREEILDVFDDLCATDSAYQPLVTSGEKTVEEWFDTKRLVWSRIALRAGWVVGHVGVARRQPEHPFPPSVPAPGLELCRLGVARAYQGRGIGAGLIDTAAETFGRNLWASAVQGSTAHRLFVARGWVEIGTAVFPDDPAPGVLLRVI